MPRLSRRAVLLIGFVIGLSIWLIPARFLGQSEPWDGNGPAYPLALCISGVLLGFLAPGRAGAAATGVFVGQLLVLLWQVVQNPESALWLVGVVMLAGYTFVATGLGALLGGLLRRKLVPETETDRRVADRRQ